MRARSKDVRCRAVRPQTRQASVHALVRGAGGNGGALSRRAPGETLTSTFMHLALVEVQYYGNGE